MILNLVEKALMNNPIRASIQRNIEAKRLLSMGGPMEGGVALEVGCGRGVGAGLILDEFHAGRVDAFDLDPRMVQLATARLAPRGERARVRVGDVEHIDATDGTYDAVFDFGIIHHVPDWRKALSEIHRVLKPGGTFYAEEAYAPLIGNRFVKSLLDHPMADRFDHERWLEGLGQAGFHVKADHRWPGFGWVVATK